MQAMENMHRVFESLNDLELKPEDKATLDFGAAHEQFDEAI